MNDKIKKVGAVGILTTMLSGLMTQGFSKINKNELDIARLQEREKSAKELLIEIKEDIKYIKDIWLFVSKKYSNSIDGRNRKYFRRILIKDFISNLFESGVKPSIDSFIKISYNLFKSNFLMINKVTLKLFLNCFLHSRYKF